MRERDLQDAIIEAAGYLGWMVYHTFDSRRSQRGYPDLTLLKDGRLIFLELKTERGKLRPEQRSWLAALQQAPGVTAMLVRPSQLDDVLALLGGTT